MTETVYLTPERRDVAPLVRAYERAFDVTTEHRSDMVRCRLCGASAGSMVGRWTWPRAHESDCAAYALLTTAEAVIRGEATASPAQIEALADDLLDLAERAADELGPQRGGPIRPADVIVFPGQWRVS
jgi:hypothetical protein